MSGQAADTGERWMEHMDIDALPGADLNPRLHNQPELAAAVARFGFADAMILDERTGRLVAGHGRRDMLRAARAAGERPPKGVKVVDGRWLAPVQRGWASNNDVEAAGFLASHNRQNELGGWDPDGLVDLLGNQDDMTGLGWSAEEIDRLLTPAMPPVDAGENGGSGDPEADDAAGEQSADEPQLRPIADYGVLVICADAAEQAEVHAQLAAEGYDCRPIGR